MFAWLSSMMQCFDALGSKLAEHVKCRSNCSNNVNVYSPRNCGIFGSVSNRWIRAITPECVKKVNTSEFYTPKN